MEQNPQNTALLVMDMQAGVFNMLPGSVGIIYNVVNAVTTARRNGVLVIYATIGFRPGLPELSINNKSTARNKSYLSTLDMNEFVKIHPDIAPVPGDITVVKLRVSAFAGSDLEVILRAQEIRHLVLAGIATSGVVLSTLREAADKDFGLAVLADCCIDPDEEVHRVLTTKVSPRQADVFAVEEWKP